jgi:hypothetical protein
MIARLVLVTFVAASGISAAPYPRQIKCVSSGSWGCSDDGICIDSGRGAGQKISFDTAKMRFKMPKENGSITRQSVGERGEIVFHLSNGRIFYFNGVGLKKESFLTDGPGTSLALNCKP